MLLVQTPSTETTTQEESENTLLGSISELTIEQCRWPTISDVGYELYWLFSSENHSLTHYYKKSPVFSRIILAIWFWVTVWNESALKIFGKWKRKTSGYSLETAVDRCVNKCSVYQSFSVGKEPPASFQSMTWTGERKVRGHHRCSHL